MARETISDQIAELESQRDALRKQLSSNLNIKSLEGTGTAGAKTEFTDPLKIKRLYKEVVAELANLYRYKGL